MGEVISGNFITSLNSRPDGVVNGAAEWGLRSVVIVGYTEEGDFYFASSEANSGDVLYFLERAKYELLKMEDRILHEGDPRGRGA